MNILEEIVANKRKELKSWKSNKDLFKKIFVEKNANIIWEIKLKSPSNSNLALDKNIYNILDFYWKNFLIKAVSNLIDKKYFSWDITIWPLFKKIYKKPILFKEFVISKEQIDGASYFWYDALLLIKRILKNETLKDFLDYTLKKNIYPIVEVDNEKDLLDIFQISLEFDFWIAINSRNLETMIIDTNKHFEIYEKFKDNLKSKIVFVFSWINDLEDIKKYKQKFNWVLIWSYFMKKI